MATETIADEDQNPSCSTTLILPLLDERNWNKNVRITLYFVGLVYCFLGVSVGTDIFMLAIDTITSKTKKVKTLKAKANSEGFLYVEVDVPVWNPTVANLTLMAVGSSAPELLLTVVECVGHHFESGELGPGTLMGSAAFNMFLITAVCMLSLDWNQTRRIRMVKVYLVTLSFSVLAYLWAFIVLRCTSPDEIQLWEALLTFLLYPTMVLIAYLTDIRICARRLTSESAFEDIIMGVQNPNLAGAQIKKKILEFLMEIKEKEGVTDEEAITLAAEKLMGWQRHKFIWYRISEIRYTLSKGRIDPELRRKLKEVFDIIRDEQAGLAPRLDCAVIEFEFDSVHVSEMAGEVSAVLLRTIRMDNTAVVRMKTTDGLAKAGQDYLPVDGKVTFHPNERRKTVRVKLATDRVLDPDLTFFVRLSIPRGAANTVLGNVGIMEVSILKDDNPGVFQFQKLDFLVKETCGTASLPVIRSVGAKGAVRLSWLTVDRTAVDRVDYIGPTGFINFKHGQLKENLDIQIIDTGMPMKNKKFLVMIHNPSNPGADIGPKHTATVTISGEGNFKFMMEQMMMASTAEHVATDLRKRSWSQQVRDSMKIREGSGYFAYTMHFFLFFWKVMFGLVPPPRFAGGWPCFFCTLLGIGLITTLIGDLASIFGCMVGLGDAITALTLVAVGTSLPDAVASRTALLGEEFADAAIGNINGSNAVNVYLGLGFPWLLASLYHCINGTKFMVPSRGLGFCVLLFTGFAIAASILLMARRAVKFFGQAEVGGPLPGRYVTATVMVVLWISYITLCSFYFWKHLADF